MGRPGRRRGRASGSAVRLPVLAEDREQSGREHDVAVLVALGLADADDHPPAVDVVDAKGDDLGDAEPGGVGYRPHSCENML